MPELICNVYIPRTLQELEHAVQKYIANDLSGAELICQWQAIRDASLTQKFPEPKSDKVPGEDSY